MSSVKPHKKQNSAPILLLACSGASNMGQLANQAALEMVEENFGHMLCTAALGARMKSAVERVRSASIVLTINGCESGCVDRVLKDLGRTDVRSVTVTETGIAKRPGFFCPTDEVERVKEAVRRALVGE
jgi:uncharacterized metal-binding protein